ncbi:MAG: DUF2332 family protein, partial [Ancalomicrobiaceae bacterium]|nr:DUF2332 family protein [Ancalomicrobiaceae bacterium]
CRVVFHTIARQYFPEATERAVAAAIERLGATATEEAPFAWLSFENEPALGAVALRLTLWPGGDAQLLATGDAHVRSVHWQE